MRKRATVIEGDFGRVEAFLLSPEAKECPPEIINELWLHLHKRFREFTCVVCYEWVIATDPRTDICSPQCRGIRANEQRKTKATTPVPTGRPITVHDLHGALLDAVHGKRP